MPDNKSENKVQFNLKNAHYALMNGAGYETPVPIPGSVNLNLTPEGDSTTFYADGVAYYCTTANNGYSGDLEIAIIPLQMLKDVWGFTQDTNKVLIEDATVEPKEFALLFQIDGDATESLYALYSVTAKRPAISSKTNEKSKEPQTQKLSMTAIPLPDGKVRARTTAETPDNIKSNWFKSVYTGVSQAQTQTEAAG